MSYWTNFLAMFLAAAPWLLLGYGVAALLKAWVPTNFLARHLGDSRPITTIKAALIGAPLPLCSCGVIPAALGLRRAGASKNATTAFLVATPETGVDSVAISYALLGPFMALIRPIAAVVSAICAGLLVGRSEEHLAANSKQPKANAPSVRFSCVKAEHMSMAPGIADPKPVPKPAAAATCCSSAKTCTQDKAKTVTPTWRTRWRNVFRFALVDLIDDTYLWLLVGIAFAALVQTFIPSEWLTLWGQGWIALVVMALVGVPMYICATASTPIAAGFLLAGVSPGAVLVFMLAGPATNIATLGLVHKELGGRALAAYLTGVIGCALVFGALVNWAVATWSIPVTAGSWAGGDSLDSPVIFVCGALLALAMFGSAYRKLRSKMTNTKSSCCG
jgi:uncharacterized membrane protein YraQ (UPF0718 family)